VFVFYKVLEVRHRKPTIGEEPTGDLAEALDRIDAGSDGFVRYKGEYWKARSEEDLEKGDSVIITDVKGPLLFVKKVEEEKE
jgi:membrane-bound serine protease (ClpP class)